jgi:flagellar biogenesis protein FliO
MDHRSPSKKVGQWLPFVVIALVAVTAGIILPQVLPSSEPDTAANTSTQPTSFEGKSAKDEWTYVPPAWPEPPNHQAVFLRLGLGTLSVLGLCAATLWCCKRWLRSDAPATAAGAQMRCIESLPLGNRCTVHLVHIGNRPVLVGADAAGIKTIVPLSESFAHTLAAANDGEV